MKAPRKFLGFFSVEAQRRRRVLVVSYYAFFAVLFALCRFAMPGPATKYLLVLALAYYLAVLLGGIGNPSATPSHPVRPFAEFLYQPGAGARIAGEPLSLELASPGRSRRLLRPRDRSRRA